MAQTAEELFESGGRDLSPEELFEQRGTPVSEAPAASEGVSTAEGLARAAAEGLTLGFSGEIAGRVSQLEELGRRLGGAPKRELVDAYLRGQREADVARERFAAERPVLSAATEIGASMLVPVPGGAAVRAAMAAGRPAAAAGLAAARGALSGAVGGIGKATGRGVEEIAKESAVPTVLGAALGGVAGAVGARTAAARGKAQQEALEQMQAKREKALRSATSALGGETSSGARTLEQATAAIADPNVDPQIKADAVSFLTSAEGIALRNQVLASSIERGQGQLGRIAAAQTERALAAQAATPSEVSRATATYLAEGLKPEVLPRAMRYASRVVPVAVASTLGGTVGGVPGAVVGSALGGVIAGSMGAPGTALYNMLKSPRFRYSAAGYAVPILEEAAARGPAAMAVANYVLSGRDKQYRKALEEEGKAEQRDATAAP